MSYARAAEVSIEEKGGVTMATNLRGGLVDGAQAANPTAAEAEKDSGRWYWFAGGAGKRFRPPDDDVRNTKGYSC